MFADIKPSGPNENISVTQIHQVVSGGFNDFYWTDTQVYLCMYVYLI
jgi:hypothetical protein